MALIDLVKEKEIPKNGKGPEGNIPLDKPRVDGNFSSLTDKISQAKERVIQDIKNSIIDISINASKALIEENITDNNNKKLVKEASNKIDKDFLNI